MYSSSTNKKFFVIMGRQRMEIYTIALISSNNQLLITLCFRITPIILRFVAPNQLQNVLFC